MCFVDCLVAYLKTKSTSAGLTSSGQTASKEIYFTLAGRDNDQISVGKADKAMLNPMRLNQTGMCN